jgi:hypothetical protein
VPATEQSLSASTSSSLASNPDAELGLALQGELPSAGAAAIAPAQRGDPALEPIAGDRNFSDAASAARVIGAGVLFGAFSLLARHRSSGRKAFSR